MLGSRRWLSERCGIDGLKKFSSTPINRELSSASESSRRKVQLFLYVTDVLRRPTGTSRSPNMYSEMWNLQPR
jgi:hypothetical protein